MDKIYSIIYISEHKKRGLAHARFIFTLLLYCTHGTFYQAAKDLLKGYKMKPLAETCLRSPHTYVLFR